MPGRNFAPSTYRYGFNGKEKDDEVSGGAYDFGARMYDSRLGRFLSLDPRSKEFSFMSPYCYAANSPIDMVDVNGEGPGPSTARNLPEIGTFIRLYNAIKLFSRVSDMSISSVQVSTTMKFYLSELRDMEPVDAIKALRNSWTYPKGQVREDMYNAYALSKTTGMNIVVAYGLVQQTRVLQAKMEEKAKNEQSKVYTPDNEIKNDPKTGNPVIDEEAEGTDHTQLGKAKSSNNGVGEYAKRRTVTKEGKVAKEIDYTDHGRPDNHPNPHQHRRDPETGKRGDAEPLSQD